MRNWFYVFVFALTVVGAARSGGDGSVIDGANGGNRILAGTCTGNGFVAV